MKRSRTTPKYTSPSTSASAAALHISRRDRWGKLVLIVAVAMRVPVRLHRQFGEHLLHVVAVLECRIKLDGLGHLGLSLVLLALAVQRSCKVEVVSGVFRLL